MIAAGPSLADPTGSGSLAAAAGWIKALVTGTPATLVATIAIACVGFLMLQGRLPLRRGMTVVLGCFVIFGASAIADGLLRLGDAAGGSDRGTIAPMIAASPSPPLPPVPAQPQVYDPYAGASVPVR